MNTRTALLFTLAMTATSHAATVIGNTATDRVSTDAYSGQIFLLNANLSSLVGQQVSSWSFFNNNNAFGVTPVLLEDTGGGASFTIRGIGATITGNGSGAQGGAFNLVSGTALIGLNYYVGYYDGAWNPGGGGSATPNQGAVEWDLNNDPPVGGQIDSLGAIWLHNTPDGSDNPANMGVGAVNTHDLSFGGVVDTRHASINFTAVPEPGTLALSGLAGLALLRRRRA